jgi:hypothetical protein
MIGHKTKIQFVEKTSLIKKKLLDNGLSSPKVINLLGSVILNDPFVTENPGSNKVPEVPQYKEFLKTPFNNYFPFLRMNIACSSFSPSFPIMTDQLKELAVNKYESGNQTPENFYYLMLGVHPEDKDLVQITFFTNAPKPPKSYVLYNKDQSFELKKIMTTDVSIKEKGKFSNNLKIYRNNFPKNQIGFEGLYVMVFEKGGDTPVFDCFPNITHGNATNDSLFSLKLFNSIMFEVDEMIKEEFGEEALCPVNKRRNMSILIGLGLFMIFIGGGIGVFYYFFYLGKDQRLFKEEVKDLEKEKNKIQKDVLSDKA